jgi:hypothetical protein
VERPYGSDRERWADFLKEQKGQQVHQ